MSRSNPTVNNPHPCTRWHEWTGGDKGGTIRYYDKTSKTNIEVELPFSFALLDELSVIKGWHDASDSGITSNEVRDTRADVMVVKAFKAGIIAEGLYATIKDKVAAAGGHYTSNLYIAYEPTEGAPFSLGSLQFKGAALSAWMEFKTNNRQALYSKGVSITGFTEGKKGKVTYRVPVFELVDLPDEANQTAIEVDKALQTYLTQYLGRPKAEAAVPATPAEDDPTDYTPKDNGEEPQVPTKPAMIPPKGVTEIWPEKEFGTNTEIHFGQIGVVNQPKPGKSGKPGPYKIDLAIGEQLVVASTFNATLAALCSQLAAQGKECEIAIQNVQSGNFTNRNIVGVR